MRRKGLGKGKGQGYKNLVQSDPYIHSLSAKGIKSRVHSLHALGFSKDYEETEMFNQALLNAKGKEEKRGLLHTIAEHAVDGAKWAVAWEKKHLPQQEAWIKNEFKEAKEKMKHLKDKAAHYRDERDVDDDGLVDISQEEMQQQYAGIDEELQSIDLDYDGVPDYHEQQVMYETEEGTQTGIPVPGMEGQPQVQQYEETISMEEESPSFGQRAKQFAKKEVQTVERGASRVYQKGREYVAERQSEEERLRGLSKQELKRMAIQEGRPLFREFNKYERELIRRQKEEQKVRDIERGRWKDSRQGGGSMFGFLNPLSVAQNTSGKIKKDNGGINLGFLNPLNAIKEDK